MIFFLCAILTVTLVDTHADSPISSMEPSCLNSDSTVIISCRDSLALMKEVKAVREAPDGEGENSVEQERVRGYVGNLVVDISQSSGSADDWAKALFIGAGVIVIGVAILYLPKLVYDVITDKGDLPVFREAAFRYAHSGQNWDGGGSSLYRDTHLASARFTLGVRRPSFGLGFTTDAGYLGATLSEGVGPSQLLSKGGLFALIGPSLRLGGDELSMGVDFLNGANFVEEIGWMSEGRFSVRSVLGKRFLVGAYVGSLFYDLRFFDGLIWRRGNFNRDLSLLAGLEAGVVF